MMIHAMAMNIYYNGRMYSYRELLEELDRGIHFAILPCGQVIQHNDPRSVLWQARGANETTCGVELLIPGVFDYTAFVSKLHTDEWVGYPIQQYQGLRTVMSHLVDLDYVQSPRTDWQLHEQQSGGRKPDPGPHFSQDRWMQMLLERWPHGK